MQEVFGRSDFQTSSAFLEYRSFEVVEPLSAAHCLPIKSENCQERRLQVEHFTPSIPDVKYRLRKQGYVQEGKFRYFGLKSRGIFTFRFPSSPPFSFFLFSVFGPGNLPGFISVGNVLGNSRLTELGGRKCRLVVEDFHHHFQLKVTYFLPFYPDSLT